MKRQQRRTSLKGYRIIIGEHALKRYLIRCEVITEEEYNEIKMLADQGDKTSKEFFKDEKKKLERKFRNSFLSHFQPDGSELRKEFCGPKDKRCTFVAEKTGDTFFLRTTFLQGKRREFWKIENARKVM